MRLFYSSLFIFLSIHISAQDERFIKEFISEKKALNFQEKSFVNEVKLFGKNYLYDLNNDGFEEAFQVERRDAETFIRVKDHNNQILLRHSLEARGRNPYLYKIKLHETGKNLTTAILYFYEGFTEASEFYGTTRLYFITLPQGNLKSLKISQGPRVWLEHKVQTRYIQRIHQIKVVDLNDDNLKEIVIYKDHMRRVYFLKDNEYITL